MLKNPGNLKLWIRYIQHKQPETQQQPPQQQLLIGLLVVFERALKEFPASFKLWKDYLDLRAYLLLRDAAGEEGDDVKYSANKNKKKTNTPQPSCLLKGQSAGFLSNPSGVNANSISPYSAACQNLLLTFADSPQHLALLVSSVTHAFERCLALCNKFPVIWLMYLRFTLATQQLVLFAKNGQGVEEDDEEESSSASSSILTTCIRRLFDRALRSLPITQHHLIWPAFLAFANSVGGPTAIRIWRRFLKLEREKAVESYMVNEDQRYFSLLL